MENEEYVCDDCGEAFDGRPYYTTSGDTPYVTYGDPLCADCAGPYLCPDFVEDATPEHQLVCIGECNTATSTFGEGM